MLDDESEAESLQIFGKNIVCRKNEDNIVFVAFGCLLPLIFLPRRLVVVLFSFVVFVLASFGFLYFRGRRHFATGARLRYGFRKRGVRQSHEGRNHGDRLRLFGDDRFQGALVCFTVFSSFKKKKIACLLAC